MSKYYYLDLTLKIHNCDYEVSPEYFKKNIIGSINQLFGESAASIDVDILKYDSKLKRAIIRVPVSFYVKVRSSLTCCGDYQGDSCVYIVNKASPLLLNLQGDSRDFKH